MSSSSDTKVEGKARFVAVKTTKGQELNVALLIENRARRSGAELYAIVASSRPKGFLVLETPKMSTADALIRDLRHVRGKIRGTLSREELEGMIRPRPVVEMLEPGMEVKVVAGPLRGSRGKVLRVNKEKNEVELLVYEATYPLKITVPGEHLKPSEPEEGSS
ncbi:MAG: transcription elongation factor Spt5 [Fervidicoccaceae archaeon]